MALQTDAVGCYPKFWNRDRLRTSGYGAVSMRLVPLALFITSALVVTLIGSDRYGGPVFVKPGGLPVGRYPDSNERRSLSQIMTNRCPQKVDPFAISI